MSTNTARVPIDAHVKQIREGRHQVPNGNKEVIKDGRLYSQQDYSNHPTQKPGGWERLGRGIVGVAGTLFNISSSFRHEFIETAWHGESKREVLYNERDPLDVERTGPHSGVLDQNSRNVQEYLAGMQRLGVDNPKPPNRLIERLGYDPKDRKSIQVFLERPDITPKLQKRKDSANLFYQEDNRTDTSAMLFVPNGDFSKSTSLIFSDAKTGEPLKGKEFARAWHTFDTQYEDMMKGIPDIIDSLAKQLGTKRGLNEEQMRLQMDDLRGEIKRNEMKYVLDHKRKNVRLYGEVNPNERGLYRNPFRGSRIDWSKSTSKDVDDIHKATPDNKLATEQPFANPPPRPQQPPLVVPPTNANNTGTNESTGWIGSNNIPSSLLQPTRSNTSN